MSFQTAHISAVPDAIAPDGSEVRVLGQVKSGSLAHFTLPPHAVSRAVAHRSVEEIWYFVAGYGRMWRRLGSDDEITAVRPGTSVTIPVGTRFQFRCESEEPLVAVGVTMPPWPGEGEAYAVDGPWQPAGLRGYEIS
jgi:mannose-6-phosphate isomerase-like protein (cupin superfamily)